MGQVELNRTFAFYAEEVAFENWCKTRSSEVRFIYACEYGTVWKFTPKEWWRFLRKVVQSDGSYDLPLSRALNRRPNQVVKGADGNWHSTDKTLRCVNPLAWTLDDWKGELAGDACRAPMQPEDCTTCHS